MRAKLVGSLGVAFLGALMASTPAHATVYQLTVDNCTGGCNPGAPGTSMGTVTTSGSGTSTLTVTVALVSPLKFVNTGLQETIDFNLSGTPTITNFTTTDSNFSLTNTTAGSEHFDGLGNFTYAVQLNTPQGAGGSVASPETFTITCATTCTETTNSSGFFFGVDVYNPTRNTTGPIGTSGGTPVPEPTSVLLFGTVLAVVGKALKTRLAV
jgi:hypothetical protein